MRNNSRLEESIRFLAFGLFAVVVLSAMVFDQGEAKSPSAPRTAAHPSPRPESTAASVDISCVPVQVSVFPGRIHVRCSAAVGGISYFAIPASDGEYLNRALSLLTTAQVAGRTLTIRYDPADTSGASYGCQSNDCRPIQSVAFGQ